MPSAARFEAILAYFLIFAIPTFLIGVVVAEVRHYFSVPAFVTATHIDDLGVQLKLELYSASPIGKAEFDRRFIVSAPHERLTLDMGNDWGGAARTSVYLTDKREIALLVAAGDVYFISLAPLRRVAAPHDTSDRWTYLGAFDRGSDRRFTLVFHRPSEQAECIPSMGDFPPGIYRSHAYRVSCR